VSMPTADYLVSHSIRYASTFERHRVGELHGLCRSPFSFPQNNCPFAKGDICYGLHLSAAANFRQTATTDSLCAVCPPTS
jgi:hypothetical protein